MNNSHELASASNKSIKQIHIKRKSEYPLEIGMNSKKQKLTSTRSVSLTPINYISNSNESINRLSQNSMIIKTKITKTSITNKASKSISTTVTNQSNKTKTKFTEGCLSNSLHTNLRKILEQEKNLDNNLKKLTTLNEDTKLKVLNEFGKKNLELFELEGLTKMLHNMKKLNETKKTNLAEINAKSQALRESIEGNLEKSRDAIDKLKSKKLHLLSKIEIKNDEIKIEEEKHDSLLLREKELINMKSNISFDILKAEEDIKIIERKQKLLNVDLEKNLAKKEEYYKNKMDCLSQILVLKPFHKKFLVLREIPESSSKDKSNKIFTSNNTSNYSTIDTGETQIQNKNSLQSIKIQKNRKILQLINEDIQFKFDYVCSLIDNPYEEINYTKEGPYLNEELLTIFMSYLIRMNQINDERDFIVLHITDKMKILPAEMFPIIQELANRISHYNDFTFSLKIAVCKEFKDVTKEIIFNHNNKLVLNINNIEKSLKNLNTNEDDETVLYFNIQNRQNKSKLKIFCIPSHNVNLATQLLSYLNDYNSKKKKEKSSKKRKTGKELFYVLEQMEIFNGFFYMTMIDCSYSKFFPIVDENLKEILLNLH